MKYTIVIVVLIISLVTVSGLALNQKIDTLSKDLRAFQQTQTKFDIEVTGVLIKGN